MAREISLNARTAFNAQETDAIPVILVTITHESLVDPVRLSTDPTVRLSTEPLRYGTISDGEEFEFVLMSALVPSDHQGQSPKTSLSLANVDLDMASVIRSITSPATVDLTLVLHSAPNDVEEQWTGLQAVTGTYDANRVTLDISREPITSKPYPAFRQTRSRFPGLFR